MAIEVKHVTLDGLELYQVIGTAERNQLTETVRAYAQITGREKLRYPGPLPVSIERADFPKLHASPYMVCEKTDGWRALLVLCPINGQNVCCLFDRKLTPYLVYIERVPVALWQGSMFDGEVVYNHKEQRWVYLLFDAVRVAGIPIYLRPFMQRLGVAARAWEEYQPAARDTLGLQIKIFLPTADIPALPGHIAKMQEEYKTDGVIFTPNLPGIVFGRHRELFKLKTKHSVDFYVDGTGRGLCVYDPTARMHIKVAQLSEACPTQEIGAVVECERASGQDWKLVMLRTDKSQANDMLTFKKTCLNMEENIHLDELLGYFS